MPITAFFPRFPGLLNQGPEGPASLGHGPHSGIFSPTHLRLWTPTAQSGVLRAPLLDAGSLYSILSPAALNFLSLGLYNNLTSTYFLRASQFRTQFNKVISWYSSRLYLDIPRPDAPVIYTGAFILLTAWTGRRSIYNNCTVIKYTFIFCSTNSFSCFRSVLTCKV